MGLGDSPRAEAERVVRQPLGFSGVRLPEDLVDGPRLDDPPTLRHGNQSGALQRNHRFAGYPQTTIESMPARNMAPVATGISRTR